MPENTSGVGTLSSQANDNILINPIQLSADEIHQPMETTIPHTFPVNQGQKRKSEGIRAIELCSGSANFSAALRNLSIEATGVDFHRNPQKPSAPTVQADLSTKEGQALVSAFVSDSACAYCHSAPPCGTASKARERPIPARLLSAGAPAPRQLRSESSPLGLPGLTQFEQIRVDTANAVYDYILDLCIRRASANEAFSVENPSTSYFWLLPKAKRLMDIPGVYSVDFQQCCHGGSRPVWRRWVTNIQQLNDLHALCPGVSKTHSHSGFGISKRTGAWKFDTASEATYLPLLCKRAAKKVLEGLIERGWAVQAHAKPTELSEYISDRQSLRASTGLYIRGNRFPALVPEFFERISLPTDRQIGDKFKLPDGRQGKVLAIEGETSGAPIAKIGVYHTPEQFISKASEVRHPIDMPSFLPEHILRNIFWNLTTPKLERCSERLRRIKQIKQWADELRDENLKLISNLPTEQQRVLEGKHILLLRRILDEIKYDDACAAELLISGTRLFGKVQLSNIFPKKTRLASIEVDELLKSSGMIRSCMIEKVRTSGDQEIDTEVWNETISESKKGWLSEELTEDQLRSDLGEQFLFARRFGIRQSGKIRAIDDYAEPEINDTVSTYEKIDLLGTDEYYAILKTICSSISDDGTVTIILKSGEILSGRIPPGTTVEQARRWLGKTYDLKSAYRQIPTEFSSKNSKLSIIAVFNPNTGKPSFFKQYATPFGAVTSVYIFNRLSRAIWAIGCWLKIVWVNFFDDYPAAEPVDSCSMAESTIRAMFNIIGWKFAIEEKKNKPFASEFTMLGIKPILSQMPAMTIMYDNKPERIQDICDLISKICIEGKCGRALMAELRGKTQYASAQTSGRTTVGLLHILAEHQYRNKTGFISELTRAALEDIRSLISARMPRTLKCGGETRPILVFTDGACEGEDRRDVTIGAVIIDVADPTKAVMWGGVVPQSLVHRWKQDGRVQTIGQAELLPTIMVRSHHEAMLRHRRVIFFIDNDSARQALIRGFSPSKSSNDIIRLMVLSEKQHQVWLWYTRVPSSSNPADQPSRGEFIPGPSNSFAKQIDMPEVPACLYVD